MPQPQTFNGDFADPPKALAALCLMPNWVTWRWQRNERGYTKPPFRCDDPNRHAANNDPKTWGTRAAAVSAVLAGKAAGVGFVLTDTDVGAIDLDKCRDPETLAIAPWARKILDIAPHAYSEATVSGTGLHILGIATGPEVHRAFNLDGGGRIEIFRRATRYITVSGLELGDCTELPNIDRLIDDLVGQYDDVGIKKTNGHQAGNGADDIDNLVRRGAPEGQRSEAFARCVWSLAGQGLSQEEIEQELCRHPDGIAAKYGKRLSREIERCYEKWQRENSTNATSSAAVPAAPHSWDDPDVSILDDRRGELPEFPLDVLSPSWQEWAANAAHGAGCAVDHVIMPLLAVASSLVGSGAGTKPMPSAPKLSFGRGKKRSRRQLKGARQRRRCRAMPMCRAISFHPSSMSPMPRSKNLQYCCWRGHRACF
jgi:putative DNA primase/helicase